MFFVGGAGDKGDVCLPAASDIVVLCSLNSTHFYALFVTSLFMCYCQHRLHLLPFLELLAQRETRLMFHLVVQSGITVHHSLSPKDLEWYVLAP